MPVHLTWGMGVDFTGAGTGVVVVQDIFATVVARETVHAVVDLDEDIPTATVTVEPIVVAGTITPSTEIFGTVETTQEIWGVLREDGDTMSAPISNVEMFLGDDRTLDVSVHTPGGDPVSIAGAKMWLTVKSKLSDPDVSAVLAKKNLAAGGSDAEITFTDETNGLAEVYIVPDDGDNVEAGLYSYDIQVTLSSGKTYTIVRGKITFKKGVTLTKA